MPTPNLRASGLLVAMICSGLTAALAAQGLRDRAAKHDLPIGSAVRFYHLDPDTQQFMSPFRDDAEYREALAREFSLATPENVMKMASLRPDPSTFAFADGDELVAFAEENGMGVRGHTLVWHNQVPQWLADATPTRRETRALLEEHVRTVVEHFRGRVVIWDVVNEAIANDGSPRETLWSRAGRDYIARAFEVARRADPEAVLCYNDTLQTDIGTWHDARPKADGIYELVAQLVRQRVPIDCVGIQMHVRYDFDPAEIPIDVAAEFQRYADLGLQVQITELDVSIEQPASAADLRAQGLVYEHFMELCLTAPNCTAFVIWGFTDRYSWIPQAIPGWGSALILDERYKKKPAYRKLNKALR